MGRIGKRIIIIPAGVEVKTAEGKIMVKGPKGSLQQEHDLGVKIEVADGKVSTQISSKDPKMAAMQGLYNSLIKNMIDGVTKGFEKRLEIEGVGYRALLQGKNLQMQMGFSHPIIIQPPAGIDIAVEGTNKISIKGIDKHLVGALARGLGSQQGIQAQAAHGTEHGLDMAVRQVAFDDKGLGGGQESLPGQGAADEFDQVGRQVGDVAQGFVLNLGADTEGSAQQVGVVELALIGARCGGHMNAASS